MLKICSTRSNCRFDSLIRDATVSILVVVVVVVVVVMVVVVAVVGFERSWTFEA